MGVKVEDFGNFTLQRWLQEGKPFPFQFELNYSNTAVGNATFTTVPIPIGKYLYIPEILASSNISTPVELAFQVSSTVNPANLDQTANNNVGLRSVESVRIDQRGFVKDGKDLRCGQFEMYDRSTLILGTRDTTVTVTGRIITTFVGARLLDADTNWTAEKVMIGRGDSILSPLNGGTNYTDSQIFFTRIRDYYINKNINVRKNNKAEGGRISATGEAWQEAGYFNTQQSDLLVYNYGVNDAASNPFNAGVRDTYKANVLSTVTKHQAKYRKKPIILLSCTPISDNTHEANAVVLRQDLYDMINALPGTKTPGTSLPGPFANPGSLLNETSKGKILVINCGTAFNRSQTTWYDNSLGIGDGLHPNAIRGHAAIFDNCIKPALDAWLPKI
ncbi:SGNH/GDSL hydrolase family protein [Paraflavitalea sp. CAU 1676]|uniref:SGNH/GDSL hydrolase family protein n=1 Tax=Paraflavitalea sp. CAU 1676 TaxID=3032598 RepID=UPI0023DA50EA|nr:SGNH/GDSL hydrolase family protein [Paraflavitalea sp. CAU 1676]MDF2189276.1 SGNH/GDSL hydrolase family protein [Paraflavitalea sp. CAU 1676]